MSKTRICFIQTYAYPLLDKSSDVHGGSEVQLYFMAKEIAKVKHFDVYFIVGDYKQQKVEIRNDIKTYKAFNPQSSDSLVKKLFQAIKYYILFQEINADIYFTSSANSTVGLVSLFCKLNHKKHIHRTASEIDVDKTYITKKGIIGKLYRWGLENSDVVTTQNKNHKKLLKRNHNKYSIVIKNSFPLENKSDEVKTSILWVSRCERLKKPNLFLDLAKHFKNFNFVMICPKIELDTKYFNQIKESTDKINNIQFIDYVPFNQIQKYFDEARVFINTSDYEGFPNTFIQAGLGKTPLLSLNVNPDDFIDKYNCGYYCNNDFNEMIRKLNKLLFDENDWAKKSENVFSYVKENHNIKQNIHKLEKLIIYLMEGNK